VQDFTHKTADPETTEWEDVLVKHGIIPERAEVSALRDAKAGAARRTEKAVDVEKELDKRSLEDLDELEDEVEEELLQRIRDARIRELRETAAKERFGSVYPIAKAEFIKEVTEASKEMWVVVEMFKDGIQESTKCSELLRTVAARKRQVKFVRIRSTDCVEGWPDSSVPALFLYHEGKMQQQLVGLAFCGGAENCTEDSMELALSAYGVFESDLLDDVEGMVKKAADELDGIDGASDLKQDEEEREAVRNIAEASAIGHKISSVSSSKSRRLADLNEGDDDDDDW